MASPRSIAAASAATRIGLGVALLVAPGRIAATWTGRDGATAAGRVLAAGLGARDVAIGVGTAWALGQGFGAGAWLRAGAVGDAVDCLMTLRSRDSLPALRGLAVAALAAGGALSGAWLSGEVD
jgi:hypothetical protein